MLAETPVYPPENIRQALLAILAPASGIASLQLAALTDTSWQALAQFAIRQELAPLLYRRLEQFPALAVPAPVWEELRRKYTENALKNLRRYGELHRVLEAFQGQGIAAVALKGAYLAQAVYGDIALRSMNDLDLLVRQADLGEAGQDLARLGYEPCTETAGPAWYFEHHFHFAYVLPATAQRVELHWGLVPPDSPFSIDLAGLWQRAVEVTLAGKPARVLSPEDLVAYLCLHVATQAPFSHYPLRSLLDIACVLHRDRERFDWQTLLQRAREWQAINPVYLTLLLAQKLFGASLPDPFLEALRPAGYDPSYLAWAEERAFYVSESSPEPALKADMSENYEALWSSAWLKDRILLACRTFFPSPQELGARYGLLPGSKAVYRYYPRRWQELLSLHSGRSWLLLRGDPDARLWAERERRRIALTNWLVSTR